MPLAVAKIACFDTATLNKVAHDFWSGNATLRAKAKTFLAELYNNGIYPAITIQHICEMLRHENETVASGRIQFLRQLKFLAWLRPYNRQWFPGGLPDLLAFELEKFTGEKIKDWPEIVAAIRPKLWETGVGVDLFVNNPDLWTAIRRRAMRQHANEIAIASIARTDAGGHLKDKISSITENNILSVDRLDDYAKKFGSELGVQLLRYGDKRLDSVGDLVDWFCSRVAKDVLSMDRKIGPMINRFLEQFGLSQSCITENMTIEQLGEVAVYQARLGHISSYMGKGRKWSVLDVPISALPSYALERAIASQQIKALRVSGSDLGDSHNIPVLFYTDLFEADKRTFDYLQRIRKADVRFCFTKCRVLKSTDYSRVLAGAS